MGLLVLRLQFGRGFADGFLALGHFATRSDITNKRSLCRIGLFGLLLGPLTCSVLASPASHILEGRPFLEAIRIWFLSGALGSASTLPLILFLRTGERRKAREPGGQLMDLGFAILLVAIVFSVFWQTRYPLMFLLFPPSDRDALPVSSLRAPSMELL